ncbi:Zn-dependent alcohol dehydrogenase [Sneathiella glossodoripedis]|uniref:Zn-dependent alcohol dehydrogenase n=1 Tax=Sneathiella glossodoripedis TaxID=418853 RepID=UPI00047005E5|nr:Zn-dependent alcohol dehydrogenase [Sneathiella glossodoripedis]
MKAAICREFAKPLSVEDVELGPPLENEVRVRLAACAICHSDITYMDGGWGGQLPLVLGHEAAGVVEETGAAVQSVSVGDRVLVTLIRSCGHCASCESAEPFLCAEDFASDQRVRLSDAQGQVLGQGLKCGAFAEEVVVDQSQVVAIPDTIPLDAASLLSCGVITGFGAVANTAKLSFGSSAVVIGCGGVGLNAVQGAALLGAQPVIAVDLVADKLSAAAQFGADIQINAKEDNAAQKVREATGGGADYVFVAAGSSHAVASALEMLGPSGTLVLVGMPPTGDKVAVEAGDVAGAGQKILGSKMGSTRLRVDIPKLVMLYEQGRLKLDELISGRYPLEDINTAIDEVRADKALRNVIILDETLI